MMCETNYAGKENKRIVEVIDMFIDRYSILSKRFDAAQWLVKDVRIQSVDVLESVTRELRVCQNKYSSMVRMNSVDEDISKELEKQMKLFHSSMLSVINS